MKLSAADHQALRSAGFTPLGPVFGNHVRRAAVGRLDCRAMVSTAERQEEALSTAVGDAIGKLRRMAPDADGVIGVQVTEERKFGRVTEVSVTGVAVRADGGVRPRTPFLTDLSGRDFAKLLHSGWVPCGLALGIAAVVTHHFELPRALGSTLANRELTLHSAVVRDVQRRARALLKADCTRLRGEGIVLGQAIVRVSEPHCWLSRSGAQTAQWGRPTTRAVLLPWETRAPLQTPSWESSRRGVESPSWELRVPASPKPPPQGEPELHGRDLYAEAVFTATAITSFRAPAAAPLTIVPVSVR
ncbi:hypothetical protein [Lentzea sp.]|uniref:hypothetical protein n=1 Tax=Lentzea sp. TaxID=56099 RepID=UPI002ED20ED1